MIYKRIRILKKITIKILYLMKMMKQLTKNMSIGRILRLREKLQRVSHTKPILMKTLETKKLLSNIGLQ